MLISFPFDIAKIAREDKQRKKLKGEDGILRKNPEEDLGEVGPYLFPACIKDFELFFNSFLNDKEAFLSEYKIVLEAPDNFELDKLKPIEVIYLFGKSKEQWQLTDWRGEENENEIESFVETKLKVEIHWKHVSELRKRIGLEAQRDGKFILDLFVAVDKDLKPLSKKLIFLDMNWDAYVYTLVEQSSYDSITGSFKASFCGSEELMKLK